MGGGFGQRTRVPQPPVLRHTATVARILPATDKLTRAEVRGLGEIEDYTGCAPRSEGASRIGSGSEGREVDINCMSYHSFSRAHGTDVEREEGV